MDVVVVTVQDDVGPRRDEVVPDAPHGRVPRMTAGARREAWPVPVGDGAPGPARGRVCHQPGLLGGPGTAPADLAALRVEGDDVPAADVVGVVALAPLAGRPGLPPDPVEVVVEGRGATGRVCVLVVPGGGPDELFTRPKDRSYWVRNLLYWPSEYWLSPRVRTAAGCWATSRSETAICLQLVTVGVAAGSQEMSPTAMTTGAGADVTGCGLKSSRR